MNEPLESHPEPIPHAGPVDRFKEYRFFAESTERIAERRGSATQTYLALNASISAVGGFLVKDVKLQGRLLVLALVPLLGMGFVVCLIWYRYLLNHSKSMNGRYALLRTMEERIDGAYRFYSREYELYKQQKIGFTRLETRLPQLFMVFYTVGIAGLVAWALTAPR